MKEQLSIVLPCYNPQEGWENRIIEEYRKINNQLGFHPEIVLVNDGSQRPVNEKSLQLLKQEISSFQYCCYTPNKGKGHALRKGISLAQGELVIFTDIDFPYTTNSLIDIWKQLHSGNDIVIGIKDASYYESVPKTRVIISKLLRSMIGFFFSMPITDTQCGLKGFNQQGRSIFLTTSINRYLCDLEFIYKSYRHNPKLQITPHPATLREGVVFSRMNTTILVNESIEFLKLILKKKNIQAHN